MSKGERIREERAPNSRADEKSSKFGVSAAAVLKIARFFADLSGRQRIAIGVVAFVAAGLFYLALPYIPGSQHVELDLKAGQGTTTFSLASEIDAVSPGCGCPHPEWGRHPWKGMSVPSRGFHLDVNSQPSDEIDPELWSLTAMAPNTGAINWYGEPNRALWIVVEAQRPKGGWNTLYFGGTSYFMLWTSTPVFARQSRQYPYAAVLPAAGGSTTFTTHEPSRDQWAGAVDVSTTAPARAVADPKDAGLDADVSQRGPMIDVLGPELTLRTRYTAGSRLWTGQKEIKRADVGQPIRVEIYTPFAIRLIPHPIQAEWRSRVTEASAGGPTGLGAGLGPDREEGPRGRSRIQLVGALPPYTVSMNRIRPPGSSWSSFAERSSTQELVSEMMGTTSLDPLPSEVWHSDYGLPPVTVRPQIGVFGRITDFDSTSIGGTAVIGSDTRAIPRGEELEFESDDGLEAGQYHFTPLVAAGQETAATSIYGTATIFIGGSLASHPEWLHLGLISAVVTVLLGILLSIGLDRWFSRNEVEGSRDLDRDRRGDAAAD